MTTCDDVIWGAEEFVKILDCLCLEIGDVCSCILAPGPTPAFDFCGECGGNCGNVFVTMNSAATVSSTMGQEFSRCDDGIRVSGTAGVLRCVPVDESGLPDVQDSTAVSLKIMDDMMRIRKALVCCYEDAIDLNGYAAISEQGGCAGGAWTFTIGIAGA